MASIALLVLVGCDAVSENDAAQTPPPPPQVTVASPTVETVTDWDEYTGRFGAVSLIEVRARVSGYLEEVRFQAGQIVDRGDILFVIDKRPFQVALDEAEADLIQASVDVEFAERELARGEELLLTRAISDQEVDRRRQDLRNARAGVQAAQARVRRAELDLEFAEVRAPITGRISREFVNVGNLVSGGDTGGTELTRIVSMDPIHFYFDAAERDFLRYARLSRDGGRVSSREAANPVFVMLEDEDDFIHEGRMDFVDNRISPDTGTIRGRAIFDNPDGLLTPGLFGRMRLVGSEPYEAVLVPDTAIASNQDKKFVLVVDDDNVVEYRPVTIGALHGERRVIHDGLSADETIVVSGLLRARPGAEIRRVEAPQESAPAGS
ncbi:MAG: efflux RND transporter periplasmic adaptor subunit [Geminicoccaceae bacterium]